MSTIPQRKSRTQEYDLEEDDAYYVTRQPTSAVRYTQPRQQVIQRGNKRIVIHNEPPPSTEAALVIYFRRRHDTDAGLMGAWQLRAVLVAKPPTRQYLRYAAHLPDRSGGRTCRFNRDIRRTLSRST